MKIGFATCSLAALGVFAGAGAVVSTPSAPAPMTDGSSVANRTGLDAPVMACFTADASEQIRAIVHRAIEQQYRRTHQGDGLAHNMEVHWLNDPMGEPVHLTWSVVPDGLFIPNGVGEGNGQSNFRSQLANMFGSYENGLEIIRQVFEDWAEQTGNEYTEVSDDGATWGAGGPLHGGSGRGDIRLAMKNFSNQFFGVLAYNYFPDNGDMVMNSDHVGDFDETFGNFRVIRNTMMHEHGHGVGLAHVCPANGTKLMEPALNTNFDGLRHDDLRGGQRGYGDSLENNDSAGDATDLGSVSNGFYSFTDISIDDNADFDWFAFTVGPNKQIDVSAIPQGFTYPDYDQNQFTGQCNTSGPIVNSKEIHDLRIEIKNSSNQTIFESDNSGLGDAEIMNDFVLPGAGQYYIRILGTFTENDIQIYDLGINVEDAPVQSQFATLVDLGVESGTLVAGNLASLEDSDNQSAQMRTQFGVSVFEPNLHEILLAAESPFTQLSQLDLIVEGRMDTPNGVGKVRMFNWNANAFQPLFEYDVPTQESNLEFTGLNTPNAWVRDSDGRIELKLKHVVAATFSVQGANSFYDRIAFRVTE